MIFCEMKREKHGLTMQMHSDSKKRRIFVALLFAAGDLRL